MGTAASLEESRVDDAGNDNVDPDTGLGGLGPQAFGERVETRFGCRVDGFTSDTDTPGDRRHEADRTVVLSSIAAKRSTSMSRLITSTGMADTGPE